MPVRLDRQVFVAYPWALYGDRATYKRAYTSVERALDVKFVFAEARVTTGTVLDKIIAMIEDAAFGIYDVSSWNANVTLEYGIAHGLGSDAYIAFNPEKTDLNDVPSDVRGYDRLQYRDLGELQRAVEDLVVQVLGTGTQAPDPMEEERQRVLRAIGEHPRSTARQLAEQTGMKLDLVQLLLRRSGADVTVTGQTRGTKYTLKTRD